MNRQTLLVTLVIILLLPFSQASATSVARDSLSGNNSSRDNALLDVLRLFKPLPPTTVKFRERGRYNLGRVSSGVGDGIFITDGPRAEDVMVACNQLGPKRGYTSRLCVEPSGQVMRVAPAATGGGSAGGFVLEPVDLESVASAAVGQSSPGGLTLHVQPSRGWVYTGVPTIAYLTGEGGLDQVGVDGFGARVRWEVVEHQVDFGDPSGVSAVVLSRSNGAAYPNESITWDYQQPGTAIVQVVTTWRAVVEVGGESYSFDSARTTRSNQVSLEVRKPKFSLISPNYTGK